MIQNPADSLRGALLPVGKTHFAALTKPKKVAELLRMIDDCDGTFIVVCALRIAPLVFVRPGELRKAKWNDVDFERPSGVIPLPKPIYRVSCPLQNKPWKF